MRYIPFAMICIVTALEVACTSDKGKNIQPPVIKNAEICDTSAVISYSTQVAVIINDNCISCHDANQSTKLYNYATVKTSALAASGSLYGSVAQNGTAIPMPPNKPLSPCDIEKIRKWTVAGAPNN